MALSSNFGKGPWSKFGKINDIKHINGSKIYPQNHFVFRLFYAKHKCFSIILIWVIVVFKKITFLFSGKNRHGIGKKGGYFFLGNGTEIWPLEKGRKSPGSVMNFSHIQFVVALDSWVKFQDYSLIQDFEADFG